MSQLLISAKDIMESSVIISKISSFNVLVFYVHMVGGYTQMLLNMFPKNFGVVFVLFYSQFSNAHKVGNGTWSFFSTPQHHLVWYHCHHTVLQP